MAATTSKKFSNIARTHFSDGLGSLRNDICSARFSMQYLRPRILFLPKTEKKQAMPAPPPLPTTCCNFLS